MAGTTSRVRRVQYSRSVCRGKGTRLPFSVDGVLCYCMRVEKSLRQTKRPISAEGGESLVREYVPSWIALWVLINDRLILRTGQRAEIRFEDMLTRLAGNTVCG